MFADLCAIAIMPKGVVDVVGRMLPMMNSMEPPGSALDALDGRLHDFCQARFKLLTRFSGHHAFANTLEAWNAFEVPGEMFAEGVYAVWAVLFQVKIQEFPPMSSASVALNWASWAIVGWELFSA